ncbi:response regulator [Paenibacillus sp. IB182496]|uniref:Response regulator n=1 Tax=Paenibacillus sabuli TaxID=2772509 RepID=A0A927GS88_9BACL|nr:response regulator [Paenibacillus sabuli]MBD2846303.1 response regulator [Paenibacillus sabuli]
MIKLLIADDEKMIREGIAGIVDWRAHGIELAGVAADGHQARTLFAACRPDIVVTDIRMPGCSGLELARGIRASGSTAKVVILSGYEDFDYAQEALRLGAADYLLKPVMPDELVAKVLEARDACRAEQRHAEEAARLRAQLGESMPLLRERFLQQAAAGLAPTGEELAARLRYLGLPLAADQPCRALLVQLEPPDPASEAEPEEELQLRLLQAGQVLQQRVDGRGGIFPGPDVSSIGVVLGREAADGGGSVSLRDGEHDTGMERVKRLAHEWQAALQQACGLGSTIGIGLECGSVAELRDSYISAGEACKYKAFLGGGHVLAYSELQAGRPALSAYPEEAERELVLAVKQGESERLTELLARFYRPSAALLEPEYAVMQAMRLLSAIGMELLTLSVRAAEVLGPDYQVWDRLHRSGGVLPDLLAELEALLDRLAAAVRARHTRRDSDNRTVAQMIAYLQAHYNEPFRLDKLSEQVYLSPNYVCSLFKEETGRNISEYLIELRIERAKALLADPELKVYEIARRVGYTDSRYFNKLFKRHTGMNLSDYRRTPPFA